MLSAPTTEPMPHQEGCRCPVCRSRRGERRKRHPVFAVRIPAELQEWMRARPEGATAWLERVITVAKEREEEGESKGHMKDRQQGM